MEIIETREDEELGIKTISNARSQPKEDCPYIDNSRWGKKDSKQTHYEGLRGEYAVSQHLWIPLDISVKGKKGDGNSHDLKLRSGKTISVKTREKVGYDFALKGTDRRELVADYCILCYNISDHEIGIFGWATKKEFLANCHQTNYSHGDRLVLSPKYFHDMGTFPW